MKQQIDPGTGWMLLKSGDTIEEGDEHLIRGVWTNSDWLEGVLVDEKIKTPIRRNMHRKIRPKTNTFFNQDFPSRGLKDFQHDFGFSLYRGVVVQWSEDHDKRVFTLLDEMSSINLSELVIVQSYKGCVDFRWKSFVPIGYEEGKQVTVERDVWSISTSVSLSLPS